MGRNMDILGKLDEIEALLKHLPLRHDQQRHAGSRDVSPVNVRSLYDRADRQNPERIKFTSDMAEQHINSYPESIRRDVSSMGLDIVISSEQFIPSEMRGSGGGYIHGTVWISNNWQPALGYDLLDHEVGHALIQSYGPRFAEHWYTQTGTRLVGDYEEDASDQFSKYIAGLGGEVWGSWYDRDEY